MARRPSSRPQLFGPNGKPLAFGLYPSPRREGLKHYRPRHFQYSTAQDTRYTLDQWEWLEMLTYSRQFFAQSGTVGGSIVQKNEWAYNDGWTPQYIGGNKAWGEEAEEWLREVWMPVCNVRGQPYDFKTSLFLDGLAMDVDGDQLCSYVLTDDAEFPMLQFIKAHRINSIGASKDEITEGPFKWAKIYNGIIMDRKMRTIGYRVQTGDGASGTVKTWEDIPANRAQLLYEPEWSDQIRGIPKIGRVLLDEMDVQDIDFFLKRQVKMDSSQGILHYNEAGEAIEGEDHIREEEDVTTSAEPQKIDIEEIHGGEMWYLKANSGEKLEPYSSDRPHPNTENFVRRIETRALFAIGWSRFMMDPASIGGAPVRMIIDLVQNSIRKRQQTSRTRAKGALLFAVATAMRTGRISKNYDDFYRWNFDMPQEVSADTGNEQAADRDNYKLGTTSMAAITQKKGKNWEEVRDQLQTEAEDLVERALEMVEKFKGKLTFERAMDLISQRFPNATPPPAPQQPKPTKQP